MKRSSDEALNALAEAKDGGAEEEQEEEEVEAQPKRRKCPYLGSVNRQLLDFDSEKLCSVTLTNRNVYVCLVCGKYFEGRGRSTPAFTHSLQCGHFVFMNIDSGRSYCLPDGYEVFDSSLQDIQRCLAPTFSLEEIAELSGNTSFARDVHGMTYLPGFVGLNNLTKTDDINAVLYALSHVAPLRDFFLQPQFYSLKCNTLVREFGLAVRKLWSSHNFKSTVSPQELVQHVSLESKRRFAVGTRSEAIELLIWLLNALKRGLGEPLSKAKDAQSVIFEPFQGVVQVETLTQRLVDSYSEQKLLEKAQGVAEQKDQDITDDGWVRTVTDVNFNYLSLDIPPCPLFRDSHGGLVIPQVPLYQLLQKFDGSTWTSSVTKEAQVRRRYRIKKLPRYLILHLVRFTKNNFTLEKNPTIVTFPVRNLEMRDFLSSSEEEGKEGNGSMDVVDPEAVMTIDQLSTLTADTLQKYIKRYGAELHVLEAQSLISRASVEEEEAARHRRLVIVAQRVWERIQLFKSTKYDLVANICHESTASVKKGVDVGDLNTTTFLEKTKRKTSQTEEDAQALEQGEYKVHLHCREANQWYEIQDLHVHEITPQQIGVSESYILVYEKKTVAATS